MDRQAYLFLLQQCIALDNFFGWSFGLLDLRTVEPSDYWAFGLSGRHPAGRGFTPGTRFSPTNKTNYHDIIEILLKVALNTITPPFSCAREDADSTHYKTYEKTHS